MDLLIHPRTILFEKDTLEEAAQEAAVQSGGDEEVKKFFEEISDKLGGNSYGVLIWSQDASVSLNLSCATNEPFSCLLDLIATALTQQLKDYHWDSIQVIRTISGDYNKSNETVGIGGEKFVVQSTYDDQKNVDLPPHLFQKVVEKVRSLNLT